MICIKKFLAGKYFTTVELFSFLGVNLGVWLHFLSGKSIDEHIENTLKSLTAYNITHTPDVIRVNV